MKLYYTSASGQDVVQSDPYLSLGGYRSASLVPSGAFGALFDEVTQFLLNKEPTPEYIGLVLKNDTVEAIENLWLWFEYPAGCYAKLTVAAVELAADASGVLAMERIYNRNARPSYAEFSEADGIENAVSLGNVEAGAAIGLWLCRELVSGLATTVVEESNLYETNPTNTDLVQPVTLAKTDNIALRFRYGESYYGSAIGDELI